MVKHSVSLAGWTVPSNNEPECTCPLVSSDWVFGHSMRKRTCPSAYAFDGSVLLQSSLKGRLTVPDDLKGSWTK